MKSTSKLILMTVVLIFLQQIVIAQDTNKTISLVVNGQGKTQEEAKQNALRNAIEQAFGAFVSSKTEILNENLINDEIVSVANGNIQNYTVLDENTLPDGTKTIILKANVSVLKLISFCESKGVNIEFKGGLFSLNIKQQMLNEQGEINTISFITGILHELMQSSFDYKLTSTNPISIDEKNEKWNIPLEIKVITNSNFENASNYLLSTLKSISLSEIEKNDYVTLGKNIYDIKINFNNKENIFYFRNKMSIHFLKTLNEQMNNFYTRNFTVSEKFTSVVGYSEKFKTKRLNPFGCVNCNNYNCGNCNEIKLFKAGELIQNFKIDIEKTLNEINNITEFKVNSNGIVSKFNYGGIVVYEKNGHGLVVDFIDLSNERIDWVSAKKLASELKRNGYNDWFIINGKDFQSAFKILSEKNIGNFYNSFKWFNHEINYWTNDLIKTNEVLTLSFSYDYQSKLIPIKNDEGTYLNLCYARAFRKF